MCNLFESNQTTVKEVPTMAELNVGRCYLKQVNLISLRIVAKQREKYENCA